MKTKKMRLIALMITLAAVMTGVNAEAQRREYRSERDNTRNEKRQYTERKINKKEYQKSDNNKNRKNDRDYHAEQNAKSNKHDQWGHQDYSNKYHKKNRDNHYKYDNRYEYRHPQYGHVYKKFRSNPIRIKHHNGDYYFYGGNYYHHHQGIGYVRVEIPRHLIFGNLPFHCERIRLGHHVYYRYGDLLFERCDYGYRIAPNVDIHLSAHF